MSGQAAPRFALAPGSIARLRAPRHAGIDPEVLVSGVDETTGQGLGTAAVVGLLAERKATAVANRLPDALVLGCDSLLGPVPQRRRDRITFRHAPALSAGRGQRAAARERRPVVVPACGMTRHRHIVPMYQSDISGRWFA
jgi:hypothetical protein